MRSGGAVAIKFEAAYLRPLDFDEPDAAAAQRVYAKYVRGGVPTHRRVQDARGLPLPRDHARSGAPEARRADSTCSRRSAASTRHAGSAPHLLEPAFNDSTLRVDEDSSSCTAVGRSSARRKGLWQPNVYADISMMETHSLADRSWPAFWRQWLGEYPEKVLFGTDAFRRRDRAGLGAGRLGGVEHGSARAFGIALTACCATAEITRDRAQTLARMVLRVERAAVYSIPK
jgi:hypothetical protein